MEHTLYRKYRPQTFADVVGQNHIKVTLQNELVSGKIAHAYLFTGPRGVGKTTIARILAKAVNCGHPQKDGDPDDACTSCVAIREGRNLDVIEIDAASNTGVDNVRTNIIEHARFSPVKARHKVFIIDEVHMLSISAFNALLKTLEEPPEHVLFVLATTEAHKVPETIVSRCQRFDFRLLRQEDLMTRLKSVVSAEHVQLDDAVIEALARSARGSSRDAESMLGQVLTLGDSITLEQAELVIPRSSVAEVGQLFDALIRKDAVTGITIVNTLATNGVQLTHFVRECVEFFRKALLLKVHTQLVMFSSLELPKEEERQLLDQVEKITLPELQRMVELFVELEGRMKSPVVPQLPLELVITQLTASADVPVVAAQPPTDTPPVGTGTTQREGVEQPAAKENTLPSSTTLANGTASALSLGEVTRRWADFLQRLQTQNQSLRLTCNVASPHVVQDGVITLGVAYEFHRERIELPKNRIIIEKAFTDLFGFPVAVRAVVAEQAPKVVNYENEENVEIIGQPSREAELAPPARVSGQRETAWEALIEAFGTGNKS